MPGSEHGRADGAAPLSVVRWDPSRAGDFDRLNRWWLEKWFTVEPLDEAYLRDPHGKVIAPGGEIFFALDGAGRALGCVAAVPVSADEFELAKLGVDPEVHGRGIGQLLCEAMLAFARERGAAKVHLVSNSGLKAAIRLYERLGFVHAPFPFPQPYVESDVYMELLLSPAPHTTATS